MKQLPLTYGPSSHAIHAGEPDNDQARAHVNPIYQSATFGFADVGQGRRLFAGEEQGYIYSRWHNPTVEVIEEKLAALEGVDLRRADANRAVTGLAFSSGMAAISSLLMTLLRPGDTILTHGGLYGGTSELMQSIFQDLGIQRVLTDLGSPEVVEAAIRAADRPRVLYLESPANPVLDLVDIAMVAQAAQAHGLKVVVDNTFATPILQQPLALGADFVVHSTTKYLNGHGTTVGGIVLGTDGDFIHHDLWERRKLLGGSPSPFDAWLINQGLKTLALRMERHSANALTVARWLDTQSPVARVHYPGLDHFRYHELAKRQMKGFGGMIAFELQGGVAAGTVVMNTVQLCSLAVSLGTVDTTIMHPASMSHAGVPREQRLEAGITDGLVRLSVGLEDVEDIIDDLGRALGKI
ncbi:MAG: PLP-dependent transferase [Candidatus Marinimicrobia bacterium]|nr:PLP-dependent transferase [Candidatus Neomarinimicrobiota bacterium]